MNHEINLWNTRRFIIRKESGLFPFSYDVHEGYNLDNSKKTYIRNFDFQYEVEFEDCCTYLIKDKDSFILYNHVSNHNKILNRNLMSYKLFDASDNKRSNIKVNLEDDLSHTSIFDEYEYIVEHIYRLMKDNLQLKNIPINLQTISEIKYEIHKTLIEYKVEDCFWFDVCLDRNINSNSTELLVKFQRIFHELHCDEEWDRYFFY